MHDPEIFDTLKLWAVPLSCDVFEGEGRIVREVRNRDVFPIHVRTIVKKFETLSASILAAARSQLGGM